MSSRKPATVPSVKPAHFNGAYRDYTIADIEWVVSQFQVPGPVHVSPFPGRGNINLHTYQVSAGGQEFLLQKVNSDVFTMPYRVMKAMIASIDSQRRSLSNGHAIEGWEPIELVLTHAAEAFLDLTDEHGWSIWRMMVRIGASDSFKSLSQVPNRAAQLEVAEEVGRGLAIYSDLTADIEPSTIENPLPGYRDTGLYYRQLHSVLAESRTYEAAAPWLPTDPILCAATERHFLVACDADEHARRVNDAELAPFLDLARDNEPHAMTLWRGLETGAIRRTLIHGDTKIENFLFCRHSGRVKSLVDLDTIMPFTWLADWGDMVRSLANVAGEREADLSAVRVDTEVYEAVARGFLRTAKQVTDFEVDLMVDAVQIIALELGVRFLADYLRGDTYFQRGPGDPADVNKTRSMVQLSLYQRLLEFGPDARGRLQRLRAASLA